jgi:hypothetical protein
MMKISPEQGSPEELAEFSRLQMQMVDIFHRISDDTLALQAVVVVPSLSMLPSELEKISGVRHYEERMLVNLMLLRQPRTKLIYVTSHALNPVVIDYYLSMLSGVPRSHATSRLVLLDCSDTRPIPLSQKILQRPRLVKRIRSELSEYKGTAHMACYNSSEWERTLAVQLGTPLHSVDPALNYLGTKSGCRDTFIEAGINHPFGFEHLHTQDEIVAALVAIKQRNPTAKRAVVKLNDGFSGEGNAIFRYEDLSVDDNLAEGIVAQLPALECESPTETPWSFFAKFSDMGGIVEAFIEGEEKESPSCQCRVNVIGEPMVISTHDQVLGGRSGQVFLGCTFPADDAYRMEIQHAGLQVATALAKKGVVGRFSVDFVSVKEEGKWVHYAIEVNLRKGGTTHPFLTLKFLTGGKYNVEDGCFYSPSGQSKYYYATDNLKEEWYRGLLPEDVVDIAVYNKLHFHGQSESGVLFHLLGAVSEYGKLGMTAIGDSPKQAKELYEYALQVLDEETK